MKRGPHISAAIDALKRAIELHEDHIEGEVSTSMKSQKQLMGYMEDALKQLTLMSNTEKT